MIEWIVTLMNVALDPVCRTAIGSIFLRASGRPTLGAITEVN